MRRLKHRLRPQDVVLFTDWTLLRLFPPLRAMWAEIGTQAKVRITGQNAKRVLFGTINLPTAHRTVHIGRGVGTGEVRAFLVGLRKAYRRAGTIWLLAGFWPTGPAGTRLKQRSRWPGSLGSSLSFCQSNGRS